MDPSNLLIRDSYEIYPSPGDGSTDCYTLDNERKRRYSFVTRIPTKRSFPIPATAEQLSLSGPTVAKALQHMVKLGMVRETTGKQRHRLFTYHRYLEILNRGTELPKASH